MIWSVWINLFALTVLAVGIVFLISGYVPVLGLAHDCRRVYSAVPGRIQKVGLARGCVLRGT
jgi:hypothetical protein